MQILGAFEEACKDVAASQTRALKSIVQDNHGCIYLQRYQVADVDSFKANVPVVEYEDISKLVQRVLDGDSSPILTTDPIRYIVRSSGTSSGSSKHLPHTDKSFMALYADLKASAANKMRLFEASSGLSFMCISEQRETEQGIKVATMTTLMYRNLQYPNEVFTSPLEVQEESTYCHWLCALLQHERVHFIRHNFASHLVNAVRFLEKEWRDICQDIRTGSLNAKIRNQDARDAVSKVLRADAELADVVSTICGQSSWSGVLPQLFPAAKYILAIVTGSMKPYVPALEWYAGGLKVVAGDYAASEGYLGINVEVMRQVEEVSLVLVPTVNFLEFIPCSAGGSQSSELVELPDLKVGEDYEIVITNPGGLYRYRLGDVVKVTGFYHQCPCVTFSHRTKAILSISWEKTDENELQEVVMKASRECSIEFVEFTSTTDHTVNPGRYIVYCELKRPEDYARHELLQKCGGVMDASLNKTYRAERGLGVIGPLLLCTVQQGTFKCLQEFAIAKGASTCQYKAPRFTGNPEMLQVLRDNQVGAY